MTLLVAALVASLFAAATAVNVPFGGATSTATYQAEIISIAPAPIPTDVGTYNSVGSPTGLAEFCNGTYAISSSDYPDGAVTGTICSTYPEETLPQVLGSDSIGVYGASSTLTMTAAQVWGIYNGSIRSWSSIPGSGLTGTIYPIARSDTSGTTFLVTSWLYLSKTNIPKAQVSDVKWTPSTYVKYGNGTSGVITACRTTGAICYATTGAIAGTGITEVSVQNYATKVFSKGASANLANSVPATLPACTASWASVSLLNVNKTGAYALATFEYLTARQSYSAKAPIYTSSKVKAFLNWTQGAAAQNQAINYGFQPLPTSVLTQNIKCIAAIG
jgi:phosphate transport system substrate-binding protein